jgi:integrase
MDYLSSSASSASSVLSPSSPLPLEALARTYMEAFRDRLAPSTRSVYASALTKFGNVLAALPEARTFARKDCFELEERLMEVESSVSYRKLLITLLRASFRWAYDHGHLPADVWSDVRFRPRRAVVRSAQERAEKYWTPKQQAAFLTAAASRTKLYPVFYTAITTGLRIGELLGLSWAAVTFEGDTGTLNVVQQLREVTGHREVDTLKSEASVRLISIPAGVAHVLKKLHATRPDPENPSSFVFVTENGKPFARSFIWSTMQNLAETLGLKNASAHQLRHLHATNLVMAGVDLKTIQTRIGHANIKLTLQTYAYAVSEQDRKASALTDPLS